MYACSFGDSLAFSDCAVCAASQACGIALASIGWLMFGPYDSAMPHQQMPQVGSSRAASLNERIASWWLKPYISVTPWSKYFCACSDVVVIGMCSGPIPWKSGAVVPSGCTSASGLSVGDVDVPIACWACGSGGLGESVGAASL